MTQYTKAHRHPHYRPSAIKTRRLQHRHAARGCTPTIPRAFRRLRILFLGCGDVGERFAKAFADRFNIIGVTRHPERQTTLHASGARWLSVDLDRFKNCRRMTGLADWIVHSAPPPSVGQNDPRTRHALAALPGARRWVYLSTTGVYGDCAGALFDETRSVAPHSARAVRRVFAEKQLRTHAARGKTQIVTLRVPGIYAANRLPIERLKRQTPALLAAEDVFTNHIHADDLARIIMYALCRGRSQRTIHAVDDAPMKMGDYFDAVAAALALPAPPRLPRAALKDVLTPMQWTFMSESRRLLNRRLTQELRFPLRWPSSLDFLAHLHPDH